jgi:hypothetical protein
MTKPAPNRLFNDSTRKKMNIGSNVADTFVTAFLWLEDDFMVQPQ